MTKDETKAIMALLAENYRNFTVSRSKAEMWLEMLGDLDGRLVLAAVKKHMVESVFEPTIADIRKNATEITKPDTKQDPAAAWGEVERSIRLYGVYREVEALESMSETTRKVVKFMNYREICLSEEPGVQRGQFLKMYAKFSEREKKEQLLPAPLKDEILKLGNVVPIKNILADIEHVMPKAIAEKIEIVEPKVLDEAEKENLRTKFREMCGIELK